MTAAVQPPTQDQPVDETKTAAGDRPVKSARATKPDRATMVLLLIAAFVAVGGIGFALGHLTAPATSGAANPSMGRGFGGARPSLAPGQSFAPGGGAAGSGLGGVSGGVSGTVQSIDGSTMTVQLANGTTVTVDLTGSTTYHSETPASAGDVKVGSSVVVQIDTSALASQTLAPNASGARTLTAKDVLVTKP
jgi:preprotein translocase subunit YajC